MKINWLGHSSFLLTESTGTKLVTDPFSSQMVGYDYPKGIDADIVTVSHSHEDHNALKELKSYKKIIDSVGTFESHGLKITGIRSFHDEENGKLRGENIIYKFNMDGINICHLGDIGTECSIELIEQLLPVNVLMIPVGGTYTIDAEAAKHFVLSLMPNIVLPMHYKYNHVNFDIDKVDNFTKLFEDEAEVIEDLSEFDLDLYDLNEQDAEMKIVLLDQFKRKK